MAQPYVGEIRMFAGNFAPAGWMLCQGQLLPISENETLFNLIGTTYGGDGQSTFALPDFRSRVPLHMGNGYILAQNGGIETVTLTLQQLPAHSHIPQADSEAATLADPDGKLWAASNNYSSYASGSGAAAPMNSQSIAATGGSQAHDNQMPYLAINIIISLFGIFPSPA
jgi:microcystin-dependent protein